MLQTKTQITPECFGKVTPNRSNARILKGLISLGHEIQTQKEKERADRLRIADIEAFKEGIYASWGIQYKSFSINFRGWIALTKTSYLKFSWEVHHIIEKQEAEFDKVFKTEDGRVTSTDALVIHIGKTEIWFEASRFQQHVGTQKSITGNGDQGEWTYIEAREYLKENWEDLAVDFILNNLHRAEIEDDYITDLI